MLIAAIVSLSAFSQPQPLKPRHFPKDIPAGNYSGIAPLGHNRYAVVSDKTEEDGFFLFHLDINTQTGQILSATNEGFVAIGSPNADLEAIAFCPATATLFIASEATGEIKEYTTEGMPTGRRLPLPAAFAAASRNCGVESLTFGHGRFYTTTERPLPGDSMLHIQTFDTSLAPSGHYLYMPDGQTLKNGYWGVSELCALSDGRLLVLERELRVPRLKLGSRALIKLYETRPAEAVSDTLQKRLLCQFTTRLNLTSRRFANYEGCCEVAPQLLLLIADSQNQYRGLLRDWLLTIRLNDR